MESNLKIMGVILLLVLGVILIRDLVIIKTNDDDCCSCKDCPMCDVCCPCKSPLILPDNK